MRTLQESVPPSSFEISETTYNLYNSVYRSTFSEKSLPCIYQAMHILKKEYQSHVKALLYPIEATRFGNLYLRAYPSFNPSRSNRLYQHLYKDIVNSSWQSHWLSSDHTADFDQLFQKKEAISGSHQTMFDSISIPDTFEQQRYIAAISAFRTYYAFLEKLRTLEIRLSNLHPIHFEKIRSHDYSLNNGVNSYNNLIVQLDVNKIQPGDDVLLNEIAKDISAVIAEDIVAVIDELIKEDSKVKTILCNIKNTNNIDAHKPEQLASSLPLIDYVSNFQSFHEVHQGNLTLIRAKLRSTQALKTFQSRQACNKALLILGVIGMGIGAAGFGLGILGVAYSNIYAIAWAKYLLTILGTLSLGSGCYRLFHPLPPDPNLPPLEELELDDREENCRETLFSFAF